MPTATVLVPTHDHAETLPYAVGSVLRQSLQDFELFIVGDGVRETTRAFVVDLAARDPRIRFFDFPKGPRKGEAHRHEALHSASGRFVAYLGDDDLWMPNHLATVNEILHDADFGHTLHVGINAEGQLFGLVADLQSARYRNRMLTEPFNCFDFSFGAHTLEAYRRLPEGWRPPTPECPWADLYLWRQFLAQPWCRARSAMIPTGICTQTHQRPHLTNYERAAELARLIDEMSAPNYREFLWRKIAESLAHQLI